jgi:hypothetical protein
MNKGKAEAGSSVPKIADRSREGDIFPATSVDEYAKTARDDEDDVSDDDIEYN